MNNPRIRFDIIDYPARVGGRLWLYGARPSEAAVRTHIQNKVRARFQKEFTIDTLQMDVNTDAALPNIPDVIFTLKPV